MKAIEFLRSATEQQRRAANLNIDRQKRIISRAARKYGLTTIDITTPIGSGTTPATETPEIARLIDRLRSKEIGGVVVVDSLDRFARALADSNTTVEHLRESGCIVFTPYEVTDINNFKQ